jgi:hypothetical protein
MIPLPLPPPHVSHLQIPRCSLLSMLMLIQAVFHAVFRQYAIRGDSPTIYNSQICMFIYTNMCEYSTCFIQWCCFLSLRYTRCFCSVLCWYIHIFNPKPVGLQYSVRGIAAGSFLLWQRDSICYGSKIMQATEACFSILSLHGCISCCNS